MPKCCRDAAVTGYFKGGGAESSRTVFSNGRLQVDVLFMTGETGDTEADETVVEHQSSSDFDKSFCDFTKSG